MARAIILMMDSFGIGGAKDAANFNNAGANTFGHIAKFNGGLRIPNLNRLGLCEAAKGASGAYPEIGAQMEGILQYGSKYGHMSEISKDKDTVSGHWELAGLPNLKGWGHFPPEYPSFPADLIEKICCKFYLLINLIYDLHIFRRCFHTTPIRSINIIINNRK